MKKKIAHYSGQDITCFESLNLHPILARVYSHRNIHQVSQLDNSLSNLLLYHHLLNIEEAVAVIYQAIQAQEKILIIGDYDADGATSTALMMRVLRAFGARNISYLVPNRFDFGYGLTPTLVESIGKDKPDLIITVDNGIASHEGVELANSFGINVVITDHHISPDELPKAAAIVNPNQKNDLFESKNLAGVGVAFYLLMALRAKLRAEHWFEKNNIEEPNLANHLDLVALGTVADIVTLDHNNRILVQQGLARIRSEKCCEGIRALIDISNRKLSSITAADLGFAIGPRLNAAGRLEDMSIGIECLLADDKVCARELAETLNRLNQERRVIENSMQLEAVSILEKIKFKQDQKLPTGVCLFNESWHQGVIGILASRVKDSINRPVIAFAVDSDNQNYLKGSARSVSGLPMCDVLSNISMNHPEIIIKFGGHAMAAGLTIAKNHFKTFLKVFDDEVKQILKQPLTEEIMLSDGKLTPEDFTLTLAEQIKFAGPWGEGFPEPLFDGEFVVVDQRLLGQKHLKLTLDLGSHLIDAIAFNIDPNEWPNFRYNKVRLAFSLDINEYRERKQLQLLAHYLEGIQE